MVEEEISGEEGVCKHWRGWRAGTCRLPTQGFRSYSNMIGNLCINSPWGLARHSRRWRTPCRGTSYWPFFRDTRMVPLDRGSLDSQSRSQGWRSRIQLSFSLSTGRSPDSSQATWWQLSRSGLNFVPATIPYSFTRDRRRSGSGRPTTRNRRLWRS